LEIHFQMDCPLPQAQTYGALALLGIAKQHSLDTWRKRGKREIFMEFFGVQRMFPGQIGLAWTIPRIAARIFRSVRSREREPNFLPSSHSATDREWKPSLYRT